jgi:hypothetical protein
VCGAFHLRLKSSIRHGRSEPAFLRNPTGHLRSRGPGAVGFGLCFLKTRRGLAEEAARASQPLKRGVSLLRPSQFSRSRSERVLRNFAKTCPQTPEEDPRPLHYSELFWMRNLITASRLVLATSEWQIVWDLNGPGYHRSLSPTCLSGGDRRLI